VSILRFSSVCILLTAVCACREPVKPRNTSEKTHAVSGALYHNITEGRVDRFDSRTDYFPEKISLKYAKGFSIEYRSNYKILTVDPDQTGANAERFALVQRGTPPPADFARDHVLEVPLQRFAVLSYPWEGLVDELDLEDRLVGVYQYQMTTASGIRRLIDENRLPQLGCCAYTNVEALAVSRPDVVIISFTRPDPATPQLKQTGIKSIRAGYNWETSMLGRAEWSKFFGVLFNREADVESRFKSIAERYEALATKAAAVPEKPIVMSGYPVRDRWVSSWEFLRLVKDAGGIVFTPQQPEELPLNFQAEIPFERALEIGKKASVWVFLPDFVGSFEALMSLEGRIALLSPVRMSSVYDVCNGCVQGRSAPYWTEYLAYPDKVLADLVSIFHPQFVPHHELKYMRKTPRSGNS
jgi:iron complex transport system substrate-binding protein